MVLCHCQLIFAFDAFLKICMDARLLIGAAVGLQMIYMPHTGGGQQIIFQQM